jgi:hypothetical protein
MAVRVKRQALVTGQSQGPKWIWRLRSSESESSSRQATMVAASDNLPTRNEEYGTREYWCALTHQFLSSSQLPLENLGTRDTHSESSKGFRFLCSASDQGEERLRGRLTGLRVTKMLHTSFARFFLTRLRASSCSVVATRRSRKMCVVLAIMAYLF